MVYPRGQADGGSELIVPGDFSPGTWGWFTVVCYVPDPPEAHLGKLRQFIPAKPGAPLHITVLPPRPLRLPVGEACQNVASIVAGISPFQIELSEVAHFPETDFLYLAISAGSELLYQIHEELNRGELSHDELFEFRPHLTLGGPIPKANVWDLQRRLSLEWRAAQCPRSFRIEEFVCLWIPPSRNEHWVWDRFGSCTLRMPARAANRT